MLRVPVGKVCLGVNAWRYKAPYVIWSPWTKLLTFAFTYFGRFIEKNMSVCLSFVKDNIKEDKYRIILDVLINSPLTEFLENGQINYILRNACRIVSGHKCHTCKLTDKYIWQYRMRIWSWRTECIAKSWHGYNIHTAIYTVKFTMVIHTGFRYV